jgi:hypothetical protein
MRDLYVLEAFTDDGLTVRTGPHTIAEAMAVVDEHLAPHNWRHRYLPLTPAEQALRHYNPGKRLGRPVLEADFFVALRRAIIADPEHDGLDSVYVPAMLAHVDPHRPWQLYRGDEECLLHECRHPRDDHGACEGMEAAEKVCVACTAVIDSNTEFGPYIGCRVSWPCSVISSAARQYNVGVSLTS